MSRIRSTDLKSMAAFQGGARRHRPLRGLPGRPGGIDTTSVTAIRQTGVRHARSAATHVVVAISLQVVNLEDAHRTVGGIAGRAMTGRQEAAMWELIDLTGSEEPELAWLAAAGALGGMWWSDAMSEASDMVMRIVQRFGDEVVDRGLPSRTGFDTAVVAGSVYGGTDLMPRLFEMASYLPPGSGLHRRLLWLADRATEEGPAVGLPLNVTDPRPLRKADTELAAQPLDSLDERQLRQLWRAALGAQERDVVFALWDSGRTRPLDETPLLWQLAQMLFEAGRAADSEEAFVRSAASWSPFGSWETLPSTPVLNPGLRPAVTDAVVAAYCTRPIGPALHPPAG